MSRLTELRDREEVGHPRIRVRTPLSKADVVYHPESEVQVSSTIQSLPGASLAANLVVPSQVVAQTLGRPLSGDGGQIDF